MRDGCTQPAVDAHAIARLWSAQRGASVRVCPGRCDNGRVSIDRAFLDATRFRICFVCTGNICRSPMASAIMRQLAAEHGVSEQLLVTSAAVSDYHVGETADQRTIDVLQAHGYDASEHRAKHFTPKWFDTFDLIVALDRGQERVLRTLARGDEQRAKVRLLLAFDADATSLDVPDPYYSEPAFFETVLRQIEHACTRLFWQIRPALREVGTA